MSLEREPAPAPALRIVGWMLLAAAVVAVDSGRRAVAHLRALNDPLPAMAAVPLVVAPPPPRVSRRVVLMVLDGLGASAARDLPALDALRARGVDALARSHFPTISGPSYVAMLTGVEPRYSGVRTNDHPGPVATDTLFARARAAGLRTSLVAHGAWQLPRLFPDEETTLAREPGRFAAEVARRLARGDDLLYIVHGAPDHAGHVHGAASPEYRRAAEEADADLAAIVAALDLDRDTIIVTADHGHTAAGGHGGLEPAVTDVPLVLAGAGIRPGARLEGALLRDLAPTVAALLGIACPGHALGRTLTAALTTGDAALAAADTRRVTRVRELADALEVAGSRQAWSWRATRSLALAALALGLIALLVREWRRGALHLDRRVLVAAAAPTPLLFAALVVRLGGLSPSALAGQPAAVLGTALVTTVIGVVLHAPWLRLVVLRGRTGEERLAALAGTAAVGVLVGIIADGGTWAGLAAETLARTFFHPFDMVLPPLAHMAVALHLGGLALVILVELALLAARRRGRGGCGSTRSSPSGLRHPLHRPRLSPVGAGRQAGEHGASDDRGALG